MKNIGIAPLYHNAYVTVKGVRSNTSLKGLLPGKEATYTVSGITIADGESPVPTITSDKLLDGATIPYKASLDGTEKPIEGTVEEGTTAIGKGRIADHAERNTSCATDRSKNHTTDLKGRSVPNKAAHGAYYPAQKR